MGNEILWSQRLRPIQINEVSIPIRAAVLELINSFKLNSLPLYTYKNFTGEYIVASLEISVGLPSKGNFEDVDIRENEPIILFFHKTNFPGEAPQIRTDRLDFPASSLPHLNPVLPSEPAWFCLHRGHIDDWFINHTIADLVKRAKGWLEDAAKGHLIKQKDRFEATRLDFFSLYTGLSIFSKEEFNKFIFEAWEKDSRSGVAFVQTFIKIDNDIFQWLKLYSDLIFCSIDDLLKSNKNPNHNLSNPYKSGKVFPGLLLWSDKDHVTSKYFGSLPYTFDGLLAFANEVGIDLGGFLSPLINNKNSEISSIIPVFLCIKRPKLLIGADSNLEIISFLIAPQIPDQEDRRIFPLPQRDPLTVDFAKQLSDIPKIYPDRIILIGCGALGSKIGLHLGRAGITNLLLIDEDSLAPHNLVRQALLANSLGRNKAQALEAIIKGIYAENSTGLSVKSKVLNAFELLNGTESQLITGQTYIIDATTSSAVFNRIVVNDNPHIFSVFRTEIADGGRLGITLVEGRGRSPNVGDLKASLYDLALTDERITSWLNNSDESVDDELAAHTEDVPIGIGCSSPTIRLSDDVISFHASSSAILIRKIVTGESLAAGIQISCVNGGFPPDYKVCFIDVEKFKSLNHRNNGWQVRAKSSLVEMMVRLTKESSPNETGGILIGQIDINARMIYITRLLPAPPDSESSPYAFKMGILDVPEQVTEISKRTGGLIGYVGEWHSHPKGSNMLSDIDLDARDQLRSVLSKIGMVTHIMVATPKGCYPYIWN